MNLFSTATSNKDESKSLVPVPFTAEALLALTHTVPGLYQSHRDRKTKKGRNKVPRFPSPAVTNRPNAVYNIYKTATTAEVTTSTTIQVASSVNFSLGQVPDAGDLIKVFDQYRIAMVEIQFLPRANMVTDFGGFNRYVTVIDYVDSTNVNFNEAEAYPSAMVTEIMKPQTRTIIPRVAVAVYSGAFTSFMSETAPWIDCGSPNVQHYGVKYVFLASTLVAKVDIKYRYHFQFRNTV